MSSRAGAASAALVATLLAPSDVRADQTAAASPVAAGRQEPAGTHEFYLATGLVVSTSARRVLAGIGGGPGYRLRLGPSFALHADVKQLVFLGRATVAAVGASYRYNWAHSWTPLAGVSLVGLAGDRIEVVTPGADQLPGLSFGAQARLGLLRFEEGPLTASALQVDVGAGLDGKSVGLLFGLTLLEVGLAF